MPNAFNKEELVLFENLLMGFDDNCVLSSTVDKFNFPSVEAERTADRFWRPQPYIIPSYDGIDQTGNFTDKTQLSVPATIGFFKSAPWQMTGLELRDPLQAKRLMDAAFQRIASDVNQAVNTVAALQGTAVVKRTTAATGFDDVAQCEAVFNETGVMMGERFLGLNTRDYNGMANNLASRQTMAGRPEVAYGKALVGRDIAGFDILKMDTAYRQAARTATGVTINGTQRYVPAATTTAGTGQRDNVDNRYMNLNVTVTSGTIQVGDCFTIAGVNNVHQITKVDTGQLKTFRVTAIVSGGGGTGTIQISPPIISADSSPTQAEIQYKNVSAAAANGVGVTFLNTVSTLVNPFWRREALELIPGTVEYDPQAGWAVVNGTTDKNGMKVTMLKQGDINTGLVKYRLDCKFGVVLKAPEQAGVMLFNQV